MPFAGNADEAARALDALRTVRSRPGDELIVADNSSGRALAGIASGWAGVRVMVAADQRSSYYARNVAAAAAVNDWFLFVDADCLPVFDILDRYFAEPIGEDVGAIAGDVRAVDDQHSVFARYHRDRGHLDQKRNVTEALKPLAVTANVLVRAAAWRSVGGFLEGIRSGGDTEFSWRLQAAGWRLEHRPGPDVVHRHRETLRSFARVGLRYASGRAWLRRRYPQEAPAEAKVTDLVRALLATARWVAAGSQERALFRLIDGLVIVLGYAGPLFPNHPGRDAVRRSAADLVVLVDNFPERSETFIGGEICGLASIGRRTRVEAARRAERQDLASARRYAISYREDDTAAFKFGASAWLGLSHPVRCVADLVARRRWRREEDVPPLHVIASCAWRLRRGGEPHLHAHFAAGAALTAMRIGRLVGRPYSVTAHAYDIFCRPMNLREKLEGAAFVTTGCQYNVAYLRAVAPRADVHEVVMGVDGDRFSRTVPYPGGRRMLAVGRLVEKKGFDRLIEAVSILEQSAPVDLLEIVGDGPLRDHLADLVARCGLEEKVKLLGAMDHDRVKSAMESVDLLAMPCVVAHDGDRDSMPVVVKEALALEIPVVGSHEVGLPELVKPGWGRLVRPGDSAALAAAIAELLALPPSGRVRMGRAGREHVLEHCDTGREAVRLAELIDQSTSIRWRTDARTIAAVSTTSSSG
jgi:colanic acid/amylovoran biosynthesis glycosyltransferase